MRVDWHPDGARVLTVHRGALRTHLDEAIAVIAERDTLDARWRVDGTIAKVPPSPSDTEVAVVAGDGASWATYGDGRVRVGTWSFHVGFDYGVSPDGPCSLALAHDGKVLAIGYRRRAGDDGRGIRARGRGWLVLDLAPKVRKRNTIPAALDRAYIECTCDVGPLQFAFDRGRRLAIAAPEREPGIGVLRIGAGDVYPRRHAGGARAVALDDRGILAAYAYPDGVGERRLRVDYLSPDRKGPAIVEIRDTLWIDPALDDIVALAFDPTSRKIACLGASGAVEIVPVP